MGNVVQNVIQGSQNKPAATSNNNNSQPAQPKTTTNVPPASQDYTSQFFVGGALSIQNYQYNDHGYSQSSDFSMEFSPVFGYRFGKGAVGFSILYQRNDQPDNLNNPNETTWGIGAFGDYIFPINKFSILGRFSLQYNNSSLYDDEMSIQAIRIGLTPVLEYRLVDHFALNVSICSAYFEYSWTNYKYDNSISENSIGLSIPSGITINTLGDLTIGFCFFF